MDKMKDLKDLLRHEVLDLRSAEDQLIEGMPAMIERATNPQLKKALREHLRITEGQRKRIDKVIDLLGEETGEDGSKSGGFLSNLFSGGDPKCKAMEGLITEGNRMMAEDMNEEVMDAAIISCSQKMEHYEICGYGTARAFARELQLREVEQLLKQTLDEEYEADNILTRMAVGGGLNEEAERASGSNGTASGRGSGSRSNKRSSGKKAAASRSTGGKSSSSKASAGKKSSGGSASSGKKSSSGGSSSSGKKSSSGSSSSNRSVSKKASSGSSSSGRSGSSGGNRSGGKAGSGSKGGSKSSAGSKGASGSKSSAGKKGASGGKKAAGKKSAAKAGSARRR